MHMHAYTLAWITHADTAPRGGVQPGIEQPTIPTKQLRHINVDGGSSPLNGGHAQS